MNQHDTLALHTFCGWLAYVLFLNYHLDACEQISLGPHAYLSSWCVWYGLMTWSSLLMFKYLGKFILKKKEKNLQSSSLICQSPTRAICIIILKTLYICCLSLHWALSNCCDPRKNSFHAFMIKIHVHTIYPLAMLQWEVSTSYIPQNKNSTLCDCGLSLHLLLQKRHGL